MELLRTANAGVLIKMDGNSILIDGVCPAYPPYLGTPERLREALLQAPPDALAFTHRHPDHHDMEFADAFQKNTLRPILWAEDPRGATIGNLKITPVPTRHVGKADIPHVSYVVQGSKCLWITGDASPLVWRGLDLPKPDVLIVTHAYAATPAAWKRTKEYGAAHIIVLHMPDPAADSYGIWPAVQGMTAGEKNVHILSLEEKIILD